ncbi:MAG TPA: hypothetical protein PKD96_04190 [Candidatus Absconditabacterales bacterium]|nr:hypothetical protein [Candidatus Absconditabacterales bacterium]
MEKSQPKISFELDSSDNENGISEESVFRAIIQLLQKMSENQKKVFSFKTQTSSIKVRRTKKATKVEITYGKWEIKTILASSFQTEDDFKKDLKEAWKNNRTKEAFQSLLVEKEKNKKKSNAQQHIKTAKFAPKMP